jgi:hypothetical protein
MSTEFYWIAVAVITVLSGARLTRLWTADHFPPVKYLRHKAYAALDNHEDWQRLTWCHYCAAFWLTSLVGLSGYLSDFHEAWFVINGLLGGSYLASILVTFDGDNEGGDD